MIAPADDKSVDEHLRGLKVVHRHRVADEIVGRSAAVREAEDAKFLASPDAAKITDVQRAFRAKLALQVAAGQAMYRDFQGKEVDALAIEGLTRTRKATVRSSRRSRRAAPIGRRAAGYDVHRSRFTCRNATQWCCAAARWAWT